MNKKYLYTALITCAIAVNTAPLQAEENSNQKSAGTTFVCATQQDTPTMFTYTPGQVNLTPIMSWHSEYLLAEQSGTEVCQKTAAKLQAAYEQEDAKYLKSATKKEGNLVCLVSEEDQNCNNEESEKLFTVNPKYDAGCVLNNKQPIECKAFTSRGNIYSFEDKPYQPTWWLW